MSCPDRHRLRVPVRGRSQAAGKAGTCICRYLAYGIVRGIAGFRRADWAARAEAKLDMRVVCDTRGVRWTWTRWGSLCSNVFFRDCVCFAAVFLALIVSVGAG